MSLQKFNYRNHRTCGKRAESSARTLPDELPLQESGLASFCWAIVLARLEASLGFDPFAASEDVYFPVTLGDFIQVYDNGAQ